MEAKQVKDLMEAYASVYEKSEEQVIDEDLAGTVDSALKKTGEVLRKVPGVAAALTVTGGRKTPIKGSGVHRPVVKSVPVQDDVDLFDVVKGHLMSEGYADTEEAALAIMANMSEEWKQSIVEQLDPDSTGGNYGDFQKLHQINDMMKKMSPAQKKKYLDGLPRVGPDGKPLKGA